MNTPGKSANIRQIITAGSCAAGLLLGILHTARASEDLEEGRQRSIGFVSMSATMDGTVDRRINYDIETTGCDSNDARCRVVVNAYCADDPDSLWVRETEIIDGGNRLQGRIKEPVCTTGPMILLFLLSSRNEKGDAECEFQNQETRAATCEFQQIPQ